MTTLVVYHQGCADGSYAAAITALAYPRERLHFFPAVYGPNNGDILDAHGLKLEELTGIFDYDRVIVVDFSLSERQMALFTSHYNGNFKVLDHHNIRDFAVYQAECDKLGANSQSLTFASAGSGAMLAYMEHVSNFLMYEYQFINNLIRIAQLVSDRDTWQRDNKRAQAFYEATLFDKVEKHGIIYTDMPPTVSAAYSQITAGDLEHTIEQGFKAIALRNKRFDEMIKANSAFVDSNTLVPVKHAVVPCDKADASELGTYVYENYAHFQTVLLVRLGHRDASKVFVSIRSNGYSTLEPGSARHIAQRHGGEGHLNAAGFNVDRAEFEALYPGLNLAFDSIGCDC